MSTQSAPAAPSLADIHCAADRLAGLAVKTPLVSHPFLDDAAGARVLVKCENLQRNGSFKFRGAYNAIACLDPAVRGEGIVAISSGNHAQAVGEAAGLFGVKATIVMPKDAPAIKTARTLRTGARVVDFDRESEDREAVAARILAEEGGTLIHPFNSPNTIAGQGTIGLEIVSDTAALGVVPEALLIPCSGGGLAAGIGIAVRASHPDVAMVLIEPDGFDDYARSLEVGEIRSNDKTSGSICDGLLIEAPGEIAFAITKEFGAQCLSVSDDEVLSAVAFAFNELKLVVEPSGAVALAALLSGKFAAKGMTVVAVISGGNIDEAMLTRALATS
jgi:threonine dehydratase